MSNRPFYLGAAAVLAFAVAGFTRADDDDRRVFRAELTGFQEVPAISTAGAGEFRAQLDSSQTTLNFELTYSGLEGGAPLASHVHLGQRGVNGGVSFFICGGGSKPACPPAPATVTGTVVASDVTGPAGQGIAPGQFDEILRAMRAGAAYINVHTTAYPGGEIRGQIRTGFGRRD